MMVPEVQDFQIPVRGGSLYARRWRMPTDGAAQNAPIVLLHDSLGCVALWRDFPQALARATGRSVIAYDRLGFGKSSPHPGALAVGFVADEVRDGFTQVLTQLGVDRFVVLGHSVGGGMAIVIAGTMPQRCCALMTESAQTFVEDRTLEGIRAARRAFAADGQMRRLQKYHAEKAKWVLDAWVNVWLSPEFASWNLDAAIARIRCPVLAIHGLEDEYGSVAHPQKIAALATAPVTLACIPDCKHVPHRESSQTTLSAIVQFLETL